MRKRIVIGLLIVSTIGIVVFFFSQPKKGSVEWHEKRFLRLYAEVGGRTLQGKINHWCFKLTGMELLKVTNEQVKTNVVEFERSLKHLLEAGFWIRREYVFTNVPPEGASEILRPQIEEWRRSTPGERRVFLLKDYRVSGGLNDAVLTIIAPREDLARLDRILGPTNLQVREMPQMEMP